MTGSRPLVVFIVDRPGWAHDFKTRQVARVLQDEFCVRWVFQDEATERDVAGADLVLIYYWLQLGALTRLDAQLAMIRRRTLIGICSHCELSDERMAPGLGRLADRAGAVFVNSLGIYRQFRRYLAGPVFYTPNGVDTGFFTPGGRADCATRPVRIGWAGSLTNQGREIRGYNEFIVPAVRGVGGAELLTANREERWRSPAEMRDFYRSLDVYVCASESEGTPNPCLEASACGVPIVTTRVGNMPEFVRDGENGFLVERTVEAIASRLERLRDEVGLRTEMGARARRAAETWDWRLQAEWYRRMFRARLRDTALGSVRPGADEDAIDGFTRRLRSLGGANRTLLVWGAGEGGRLVQTAMAAVGLDCPAFVDSDPTRQGTMAHGRPVIDPQTALARGTPLVLASTFCGEIGARLVSDGRLEDEDFIVAPVSRLAAAYDASPALALTGATR